MSAWSLLIVLPSTLALFAILALERVRRLRRVEGPSNQYNHLGTLVVLVLAIAISCSIAILNEDSKIETKGDAPTAPWVMVGLMYSAMVLGIVAQSFYFSDRVPSASSLKAVLASPIVFIPLLSSYQSSLANTHGFSFAELMILLVSFQNGFFWKLIFDKQAQQIRERGNR